MSCIFRVMRLRAGAALAAAMLLAAAAAHAGTFEISYSSAINPAAISGDVFVTTMDTPLGGPAVALSINGERNGVPVTMLSAYAGSDQLLYSASPLVDFNGISFSTATAGDFNLFSNGGSYYEVSSAVDPSGYPWNATPINLTVSAVPEPASIALFGVGLLALCALAYGRRRRRLSTRV